MQVNKKALQELKRVVMAAPDHKLHMRAVVEKSRCGTARCALGWAIIDPWFQKNTDLNNIIPADSDDPGLPELDEIGAIFGIGELDADYLFGGDLYPACRPHAVSKQEVVDNIDRLLAGESARPYAAVHAARL